MDNDTNIALASALEEKDLLEVERKYQQLAAQQAKINGKETKTEITQEFNFAVFEKENQNSNDYENKSVLGKIGHSLVEVGSSPIRGGINAFQELFDSVGYVAKWGAQLVSGDETDAKIEDIANKVAEYTRLPNLPESDSTAGKIADGISQFLIGYVALGGFLRKAGVAALNSGKALPSLTKGAGTSAIFFDGQDANIANLIQSVPALENPITEFLATNENDSEAFGKLKNAITDFGFGAVAEGLAHGIRAYAKARRIRREEAELARAEELQKQKDAARIKELENKDQLRALLGDPEAPAFEIRTKERQAELDALRDDVAPAPGYRYDYQVKDAADRFDPQVAADDIEPPKIIERVVIPDEIKKARPEFKIATGVSGGTITARASFQTPEDKLAYIATAKRGKYKELARETLIKAGYTDEQINRLGAALREDLQSKAKGAQGGTIKAAAVGRRLFTEETFGVDADTVAKALIKVPYSPNSDIYYNFSRFYASEDVDNAVRNMAEAFEKQPAVRSWLQANLEAKDIDAMAQVLNVSKDKLLNDSESIALGQLFYASSLKLTQLADFVLRPEASDAMRYAFARHIETHRLISNRYRSSGTQVARALASRRMKIGPENTDINQRLREIENAIGTVQGADNLDYIARMVLQAKETGDIVALNKALTHPDGFWTKTNNLVREVFINGILSGAETLAVNVGAPAFIMMNQVIERVMGAQMSRLVKDPAGMEVGEAAAFFYGMSRAIPEALLYARKALAQNLFEGDTGTGRAWNSVHSRSSVGDQTRVYTRAWSSEYLRDPSKQDDWWSKSLNTIGMVINLPMSFNIATDEFWKTLAYRGELRALAFRQVTKEVRDGKLAKTQMLQRMDNLLRNPSSDMIAAASKQAEYLTFTKDAGKLAKYIQNVSRQAGIGYMFLPFINTPTNIIKYSFSRTPFQLLGEQARARIANGGYEAQAELAKIGAGTLILSAGLDLYMNGLITGQGPLKKSERDNRLRQGIQPYSIKIGDNYVQYNRIDPLGMLFGIIADAGDIIQHLEGSDNANLDTWYEIMAAASLGIAGSITNKTYFTGMTGLIEAVSDPERYGESFKNRFIGSFVPYSGTLNTAARLTDNNMRLVANELEYIKSKLPGLSQSLPPRRDLWGREMTQDRAASQMWNVLTPIDVSVSNPEPIDLEMERQGFYFEMPDKTFQYQGAKIDMRDRLDIYSRYLQLSGNEYIHPYYGLGLKDLLNAIVSGEHELSKYYDSLEGGKNGGKHRMLQRIITGYRNLAKQELLLEFPELIEAAASQSQFLEFN